MANFCNYVLTVWGEDAEVTRLANEVRQYRQDFDRAKGSVAFERWGWSVGDGPAAYSLDTECDDSGHISGTTAWAPPLAFLAELTRHRPLAVECVSTTGDETHERWLAHLGRCHHLVTVVADPKAGAVHRVEAGEPAVLAV